MTRRKHRNHQTSLIFTLLIVTLGMSLAIPLQVQGESGSAAQGDGSGYGDFHMLSVNQGWSVLDNQLYWSSDGGDTWSMISGSFPRGAAIAAVDFIDPEEGCVLLIESGESNPVYSLASTSDGGATWTTTALALFPDGDVAAQSSRAFMQWLDPQTGWLVVRQASSLNFSLGSLFRTEDGGKTWSRLSIPIGEPVHFTTQQVGWVAGGAAGDELYQTVDGGLNWSSRAFLRSSGSAGRKITYLLPTFQDAQQGLLPDMVAEGNSVRMDLYASRDGGRSWGLDYSTPLDAGVNLSVPAPLALLGTGRFFLVEPRSRRIVYGQGRQVVSKTNRDGRSANLTHIDMATDQVGLGLYSAGDCLAPTGGTGDKSSWSCSQTDQLLRTTDGGETWNPVSLPAATTAQNYSTEVFIGQGVDICDIPSAVQMQAWWESSPYGAVNLYIGGALRGCLNSLLNATLVSQLAGQGWKFIPTWVGPQAPCTAFRSRVSYDLTTAYNQGVTEADAAITAAKNLGLANPDGTNTIIYYDLEAYDTGIITCRNAMKSFMDGWDTELAAHGNKSAVYGSACASGLTDFASIPHVPDAIWLAWWNYTTYNPLASVFGAPCIANTYWPNHQRIHQYTGSHNETWGTITINVDSNVLDGILSVPYQGAGGLAPSQPFNPKPVEGDALPRVNDTWLVWSTNGSICSLHIWGGNIDMTPAVNCTSLYMSQLAPGAYSWQVTAANAAGSTPGPVWHFGIQPYPPTALTLGVVASTTAALSWTLSADDPANLDGYDVMVNGQSVGSVAKGTTGVGITGLACSTSYTFSVRGNRQGIQSLDSNTVSTTTGVCYTISGNAGVAGATLNYTDVSPKTATADGSGNYSFLVSNRWSGTVTPSKTGYTFSPASRTYSSVQSNQAGQNYTATPITYTISGNAGVAGATLSYTDGTSKSSTADASGNYSFSVSYKWSGAITPTKTGYTFSPDHRDYAGVLSNQTSQNYAATPITYIISGNAGVAGATLSYTDGTSKTASSDGSGNYSFIVSYNWTGTVTPSKTGFSFTPDHRDYAGVLTNQAGQNYTVTPITYTISGNAGVAGATLSYSDSIAKTATADDSGNYSFTVSYNWIGTVTPSLSNYAFSPDHRDYSNTTANQTLQNYTATFYSFADVPPSYWAWDWIERFYSAGVTGGCGTNPLIYCPDQNVTRAEMAVFILRIKDGTTTPVPAQTGFFTDMPVAGKEWMQPWVEQFYLEHITSGCGQNPLIYCPENNVTRAEMAVFILRATHAPGWTPPASTGIFADVPVAGKEWMQAWIEEFYREGITVGCGQNPLIYCPEDDVTRAEMAVFIDRAFSIP